MLITSEAVTRLPAFAGFLCFKEIAKLRCRDMLLSDPRYTGSKTDQIHWMYSKPIQPDQGKWLRCDGMHQARQGQQNSHLTMPTSIIEEQGWYYPGSTTSTPTTGYGTSKWQRRLQHAHDHTRSRAWFLLRGWSGFPWPYPSVLRLATGQPTLCLSLWWEI